MGQITVTWTDDYTMGYLTGTDRFTAQVTLKLGPDDFDPDRFTDLGGSTFTYSGTTHLEGTPPSGCSGSEDITFTGSGDFDGNGPSGWLDSETDTFNLGLLAFNGVSASVQGQNCGGSYGYELEEVAAMAFFCPIDFFGWYEFEFVSNDAYTLSCNDTRTYDAGGRKGTQTVEASGTVVVKTGD